MRTESSPRYAPRFEDFQALRSHWGWFTTAGIISLVLGVTALFHVVAATLISLMFLGAMLAVTGIFQFIQALNTRGWSGFFLHALIGILYGAVGFLMISHPGLSAVSLTPLIAALAIIAGLFRIAAAFSMVGSNAAWTAINGLLSLLLGLYVWWTWPVSSFFLLGVVIGVELLINSVPLLQLGFQLRTLEQKHGKVKTI